MLVRELSQLAIGPPSCALEPIAALLGRTEGLDPDELLEHQLEQLDVVLRHAVANVPYYRDNSYGELRGKLTLAQFRSLPLLSKSELRENFAALRAHSYAPCHAPRGGTTTSGSTGRPIRMESSRVLDVLGLAQQLRFHRWQGRDFQRLTAFITSPRPKGVADYPHGRTGARWSPTAPSPAVELTLSATVREQLDWLQRMSPTYLVSYPSNVQALARSSLAAGIELPELREVTVSSEPVSPELRRLVSEAWNARLASTYSANEVGGLALQYGDEEGYAVQSEFVLVEVLDAKGAPCRPGSIGQVAVTTLHNFHRPLIRYLVGDYAEVGDASCGAVRLPRLSRVMGRERNMVRLPGGDEVWPFFELAPLVELTALRQWQLVQRSEEQIEARLVVDRPLLESEEATVRAVVNSCLPVHFEVRLQYVPEIPRGPGGKYEEFVSALPGSPEPSAGAQGGPDALPRGGS